MIANVSGGWKVKDERVAAYMSRMSSDGAAVPLYISSELNHAITLYVYD